MDLLAGGVALATPSVTASLRIMMGAQDSDA
jgi:hypothetical protein